MVDDFLVARNPEPGSSLPYLIRIPLGDDGLVLKTREIWPRTAKVYCHRADAWPTEPDIVEQVGTTACVRRGAAIDLVLDRGRENRSQFVLSLAKGREVIFWQTARVARQARPDVRTPTARASGITHLEVLVDVHERYAWKFTGEDVVTTKKALRAGDYAVEVNGAVVAVVERKSLEDLVTTIISGRMRSLLAGLSTVPRAAVVVEERYSRIFGLTFAKPAAIADQLGECQARFPSVPIFFAETRQLAQQWTYRFLAACVAESAQESVVERRLAELSGAPRLARSRASTAEIRLWARTLGLQVSDRGRIPAEVVASYEREHPTP